MLLRNDYDFSQEYSVEFSCYFNVMWKEPRLTIPDSLLQVMSRLDRLYRDSLVMSHGSSYYLTLC